MQLSIKQMPDDAKVWVYQSDRLLSDKDISIIAEKGKNFINEWTAHGANLKASFDVLLNYFVVIGVDEKQALASGCSIDKSVSLMKELGNQLSIDFFNRMNIAYRDKSNQILMCSLKDFEKQASQNIINPSTLIFNNMITTKKQFDNEWEIPVKQSWVNRVFA